MGSAHSPVAGSGSTATPSGPGRLSIMSDARKPEVVIKPVAPIMTPRAPGQDRVASAGEGSLGRTTNESHNDARRPPVQRRQPVQVGGSAPSPKQKIRFDALLDRCREGAAAAKRAEAENSQAVDEVLADMYRLLKRGKRGEISTSSFA
jgi:hypothetical protein